MSKRRIIRPSVRISVAWWSGFCFCLFLILIRQDFLGKEEYLMRADLGWVDIFWPIWLPLIALTYLIKIGLQERADIDYRPKLEGEL